MSHFLKRKKLHAALLFTTFPTLFNTSAAVAAEQAYVGDIMMTAATFCPRSYSEANGQLLAISQNDALFSLYGTRFGGNGTTTFGLPDLRNRIPVAAGQGPGLSPRSLGQKAGSYDLNVTANNLAGHSHVATTTSTFHATSAKGTSSSPTGNLVADDDGDEVYITGTTPDATMASQAVTSVTTVAQSGGQGNVLVAAQQPFTTIKYCIALFGIYPSRN
ncbi:tail fiber protein [Aliiglaciecola sp. LCG003]|uniref:phage tail protein n=1 Tax=Aliiglaciecola sp. LCG003 TaxID=3053655 RepID=UPI0025741702|nr:tail fiber protein [Aliiglaciecola sp. LCG003]WJG10301.1 tail fiber protein [Aliiglaciecola sp. LCG003]